jgi:outer membrane biosynthesis protein TonB
MKLPAEEEFRVSYRLVPKRGETQGEMALKGLFTYSEGNDNKVVEIKEVDTDLTSMTSDQQRTLLQTGKLPAGAMAAQVKETPPEPKPEPKEPKAETRPETKPEPEVRQTQPARTVAQPGAATGTMILNTQVLAAGTGVYYRVQVAATQKPIDGNAEFRNKGVDREVLVEQQQGYYKYTAGSFMDYASAKNYRDQLANRRGISGAFVVAYKDGRRVPVSSVR